MTVSELLNKGKSILKNNSVDNSSNEAQWIFESVFECGREYAIFNGNEIADSEKENRYLKKIDERISGVPVQYVIGSWDFYGETFKVGEGVLIPRPETEMLVDFALEYLEGKKSPVVLDLCSGSGCVGLSVAKNIPHSKVYLIEKSSDALKYLIKNLEIIGCKNADAIQGDIFDGFENFGIPKPDLILSNPPYIESNEIPLLQSEVLKEPVMALDGGGDGLDFYRAIEEKWLGFCNGAIAVECGEGQTDFIENLFADKCGEIYSLTDFNGIRRVVVGKEIK